MSPDPRDPLAVVLNELLAGQPALASLFHRERGPRFHYWRLSKRDSGRRWDRWYAWTTERTRHAGGARGFYAMEYVDRGEVARLVRCVRFARRSVAKARARRWYEAAKRIDTRDIDAHAYLPPSVAP
jgi:hypothetical protein